MEVNADNGLFATFFFHKIEPPIECQLQHLSQSAISLGLPTRQPLSRAGASASLAEDIRFGAISATRTMAEERVLSGPPKPA